MLTFYLCFDQQLYSFNGCSGGGGAGEKLVMSLKFPVLKT